MKKNKTILREILSKYFKLLEQNNINYCVIGNYEQLPEYTTNDVDFWVENTEEAEQLLLSLSKDLNVKLYMQNKTANGSNNYFYYKYSDKSIEIIKLDLMSETAYKSIVPLVSSDFIKNNRKKYKNFYVANEFVEGIMHLFYPLVAFGIVKEKYRNKIFNLIKQNLFREQIIKMLGKTEGEILIAHIEDSSWTKIEKNFKKIRKIFILQLFSTLNITRLKIIFNFIKTIIKRIFNKNGLVISFTGIDGAGKTSIKEYFLNNGDKFFTKGRIKEFYWRPFLLPRLAKVVHSSGQKEVFNNSGRRVIKKSILKNYIKYFYYLLDFVLGKIKYFKESHTGGLIIFDRYHFDNIIYPERFGFTVKKNLMRFFDKWIVPQPDLVFYLTANTQTLYKRKYEIDINEINKQKSIYKEEILNRGDVITLSTDGNFDDTKQEILLLCLEYMTNRIKING